MIPDKEYFAKCYFPLSLNERKGFIFDWQEKVDFTSANASILRLAGFHATDSNTPQRETSQIEHEACVSDAVAAIRRGDFSKVIISRIKHADRGSNDLEEIVERLCKSYPNAFVYWINHPIYGEWIGATPEILLQKEGSFFRTMSLAGTLPATGDDIWDEKLLEEQKMVTEFMDEQIDQFSPKNKRLKGPFDLTAGPVKHLCTEFSFEAETDVQAFLNVIHPTPAICGLPRELARNFILQKEGHERRLYTGYIGIDLANGDAFYWVNLRCMQIFKDHFELHIGGGITARSNAHDEWVETERKAQALLNVITK
jgi:isochorismate synthase